MMEAAEVRAQAVGERAANAAAERLADEARAALPGVAVTAEDGRVVLAGRGLARRMLLDPALRWPGGWR